MIVSYHIRKVAILGRLRHSLCIACRFVQERADQIEMDRWRHGGADVTNRGQGASADFRYVRARDDLRYAEISEIRLRYA